MIQAKAKQPTIELTEKDFADNGETAVYWLTGAGVMINSHGTVIMIDPVLGYSHSEPSYSECYLQLLVKPPISPDRVKHLDAVLYTHADEDHCGTHSFHTLKKVTDKFYTSLFVTQLLRPHGLAPEKRNIVKPNDSFFVGNMEIDVTPCDHAWQMGRKDYDIQYGYNDCLGFKIKTQDGTIWVPGDTRPMPEHDAIQDIDLLFIDFSHDKMHWGFENAIKIADRLDTEMIMYHYGTYLSDAGCYSADPEEAVQRLKHPEKLHLLAPGEKYVIRK